MTKPDPQEIELKLYLAPDRALDFRAAMMRRRVHHREMSMLARYLDTPGFELAAAGVALRLRRSGRRWRQTLKTEGVRQGGLSWRTEFEMPLPRGEIDWSLFPPAAQAHVPPALRVRLAPVFETRFARTTWQLGGADGAVIEVALDQGEIRAGDAREPICEIELELKSGRPEALFELGVEWARRFGCLPLEPSKAERGVRLARGQHFAPRKPAAMALDATMSVEAGFAAICQDCLAQFQSNLPGVLGLVSAPSPSAGETAGCMPAPLDGDIEYVHQARVALRRLRAALRLYRRVCVPPPALRAGLRALAGTLGPTRDWDVLCAETLPAIAPYHADEAIWRDGMMRLEAHRAEVRAAMRARLAALHPGAWLLAWQHWLLTRGWRAASEAQRFVQFSPLSGWAARALRRGDRSVRHGAACFASLSPAGRHALRIRVKRLRYALEFFQALYPGRAQARALAQLRAAQAQLGRANDAHVAAALLRSAPVDPGGMVCFALGWLVAREADAGRDDNAKALQNFVKSRIGW